MFLYVVFHRAYYIEAKAIFEGRSKNTRKILQSCSKVYKLVSQLDWLSSYFHACHDEITYLTEAFFQYSYHDMVEPSMRGIFFF